MQYKVKKKKKEKIQLWISVKLIIDIVKNKRKKVQLEISLLSSDAIPVVVYCVREDHGLIKMEIKTV